jgi:hypothetical protein
MMATLPAILQTSQQRPAQGEASAERFHGLLLPLESTGIEAMHLEHVRNWIGMVVDQLREKSNVPGNSITYWFILTQGDPYKTWLIYSDCTL